MDNTDWRRQPLTWSLLKTQLKGWWSRHGLAVSVGFVVAFAIWWTCGYIAGIGNAPIPHDAKWVNITGYAQAYDVYKTGDSLLLNRVRTDGEVSIVMAAFGLTWFLIFTIQEYRKEEKERGFSKVAFLLINTVVAVFICYTVYAYAYPSALALANPQAILFDPAHDLVSVNGKPLGRMSQIAEFEGIEKNAYRSRWSWFGVKLKDGRYYCFNQGEFVGANVQLIAAYLNDYMRKLPQRALWEDSRQSSK